MCLAMSSVSFLGAYFWSLHQIRLVTPDIHPAFFPTFSMAPIHKSYQSGCNIKTSWSKNNIQSNIQYGILLHEKAKLNYIHQNNFINNSKHAYFVLLSHQNRWDSNYWGRSQIYPYPIVGSLGLVLPSWINFDWHPAQEPYDIPIPNLS